MRSEREQLLRDLQSKYGARKHPHFFACYPRHLSRVDDPKVLIEIGVYAGGSLRMWEEFLPGVDVHGIDITDSRCRGIEGGRRHLHRGRQEDRRFLLTVLDKSGPPCIVIDDGGHKMNQQQESFDVLWASLRPGGLYVIEDLHTSYWPKYGGGHLRPDSTVEFIKRLIDQVNAPSVNTYVKHTQFTDHRLGINSIEVYKSIVFIHKDTT